MVALLHSRRLALPAGARRPRRQRILLAAAPVILAACTTNPITSGVRPTAADRAADISEGGEGAALLRIGDTMRDSGDVAGAIPFYRRAHQIDSLSADPLVRLAEALQIVGAYDEASRTWRAALVIHRNDPALLRGYGQTLIALNQPQLAVDMLKASLEIAEDVRAYIGLGVAFDMIGDPRGAQVHYRLGLQMAPDSLTILSNLGLSMALSGNFKESIKTLRRVVASQDATARHRQNLALAYGLAGQVELAAEVAREDLDDEAVASNLAYYAILRAETDPAARFAALGPRIAGFD